MKLKFSYLSVLAVLSCPTMADEDALETIVVTSDFRNLSVDKLPASATVIGAGQIQARQAQHLEDILSGAVNVNFNAGASRGRFFQIRGIGERSQFAEPINPSVGLMVDDFDFSGTGGVATLYDVEQVEVIKGPQGTTFGSSAMAGVIKIKTRDADGVQEGSVKGSIAQKSSVNLAAAYGDSINEDWNFRVAFQNYQSDGYIENRHLQRSDTDNIDETTTSLKLRYEGGADWHLDLSAYYFDIDNGYDAFSLDNARHTYSDEPGVDKQEAVALGAKLYWDLGDYELNAHVNSNASDIEYGYDEDWTFVGFHPDAYQSTDQYLRERDTDSLDLRFNSKQPLVALNNANWVLGAYFKKTDETLDRNWTFGAPYSSDYSITSNALYGELYPKLSEKLTLTVGLRLENSELEFEDNTGFVESLDETFIGGRLVLDYQLDEDTLVYASVNRGYKLGGFNPDNRVVADKRVFDGEYNWNYEAGIKRYLADGDIYIALSAFYMQREDMQVNDFAVEDIPDAQGALSFIEITDNAREGENRGFELETRYLIAERSALFFNLGILDTKLEGYETARGEFIDEQEQAQAPRYTYNLGVDIGIADTWSLRLEADAKDSHRFSDGNEAMSKEYVIYHANLSRNWQQWTLSFWGKNLFNTEYYTRGFGGFPNDPRDGYSTFGPYYQIADGRKMGASLEYKF